MAALTIGRFMLHPLSFDNVFEIVLQPDVDHVDVIGVTKPAHDVDFFGAEISHSQHPLASGETLVHGAFGHGRRSDAVAQGHADPLGGGEQVVDPAVQQHPALVQDPHRVSQPPHVVQHVRGDHHRFTPLAEGAQHAVEAFFPRDRVQSGKRLVQ